MRRVATTTLLLALAAATGARCTTGPGPDGECGNHPLDRPRGGKLPYLEMPGIVSVSVGRIAVAVALGVAVCGTALGASGPTSLRVVYRATADAPPLTFTLRCNPARGTVSRPESACRRLGSGGRALFAPTPPGVACTQIYGGPQTAVVTGTLAGRRLWAHFARRDGCEVDRWNRVAFLLPRT